jgi:hypothetical protein
MSITLKIQRKAKRFGLVAIFWAILITVFVIRWNGSDRSKETQNRPTAPLSNGKGLASADIKQPSFTPQTKQIPAKYDTDFVGLYRDKKGIVFFICSTPYLFGQDTNGTFDLLKKAQDWIATTKPGKSITLPLGHKESHTDDVGVAVVIPHYDLQEGDDETLRRMANAIQVNVRGDLEDLDIRQYMDRDKAMFYMLDEIGSTERVFRRDGGQPGIDASDPHDKMEVVRLEYREP